MVAVSLPDGTPAAALALIDRILAADPEIDLLFDEVSLGELSAIHIFLPSPDLKSAITPPFMEAFLELQKQVYQLAALTKSGVADVGQLSDSDRDDLQVNVIVTGGSSDYLAKLGKPFAELLKRMLSKMTGKQASIVIIAVAGLVAGPYSFGAWLEHRKAVQIEELKSKEHIAALSALKFANEQQVETFSKLIEALKGQGEIGLRAIEVLEATNEALLKAAAKTPETIINNDTRLTRGDAELLRISPRKKPEIMIVTQRMKVIDINTSDPSDLILVLMDPTSDDQHRIKFADSLFTGSDRHKLFAALESRQPIWVELALKTVEGETRSVQLLRCVDPPTGLADMQNDD